LHKEDSKTVEIRWIWPRWPNNGPESSLLPQYEQHWYVSVCGLWPDGRWL